MNEAKLYAVTISGQKYYFLGSIPSHFIAPIDEYCNQASTNSSVKEPKGLQLLVQSFIQRNLQCDITPVVIEHIFRINL